METPFIINTHGGYMHIAMYMYKSIISLIYDRIINRWL